MQHLTMRPAAEIMFGSIPQNGMESRSNLGLKNNMSNMSQAEHLDMPSFALASSAEKLIKGAEVNVLQLTVEGADLTETQAAEQEKAPGKAPEDELVSLDQDVMQQVKARIAMALSLCA